MKKGFTLVELLAVLVILAIIVLIAVPTVTNIINKAEEDSEKASAKMYIEGVNKSLMEYNLSNRLVNANCTVMTDGNLDCDGTTIEVSVNNTVPTEGMVTIENIEVSKVQNLKVGDNYYTTNENGELIGSKTAKYNLIASLTNLTSTETTVIEANKTTTITLTPTSGYGLPDTITVTGTEYTYDNTTGVISLSNPTNNITITATGKVVTYNITTNLTNLTSTGDTTIDTASTGTVTLTPSSGYGLPSSITVTGTEYTYDNTTGVISLSNPTSNVTITATVIKLVTPATAATKTTGNVPEGNYAAGDEYIINLGGEDRIFFVLGENENDSTKIDLIMNMNYTDDKVPVKMAWCDPNGANPSNNACNHDNLDPLVSHVQKVFGSNVTVSLPSYDQIKLAAGNKTSELPTWLYDYLLGTTHPVSGLYGYWTSSPDASIAITAWDVHSRGSLLYDVVSDASSNGFRPVITISKSLMN